jgi:PST family polysaccharide transporter
MLRKLISKENKNIYQNFLSLGAIQATNYLLPLITLPYIIRVIGTDNFGVVSLAQAVLSFLTVFVDYGFGLSATRDVSIHRNDKHRLSEIFSEVFVVKFLICLACLVLLIILINTFPQFQQESLLYYFGFSLVLGQSIVPVWFYQGIEKMKYLTYLNLGSKLVFTVLIFVLITEADDYVYIIVLSALGNIFSGLVGIFLAFSKFEIKFVFPTVERIKGQFKEGWPIFVSNFAITSYNNANIIILGFFATTAIVGYYSIVEKIIWVLRQFLGAFSGAIYPHICRLSMISHTDIKSVLKSVFVPFSLLIFAICSILFVLSDYIILFVSGEYIHDSALLLKILSFVPLIIVLNNPPYQVLVAYNMKKSYSSILLVGALLNIALNFLLVPHYAATGTAIAIIVTEILITAGLYIVLETRHREYSII